MVPTRTSFALPPGTTFQRARSQRNWLLKTHPQAFLGNWGLPSLISEESRTCNTGDRGFQTISVLDVGEIADLRNTKSSRIAAWPVVALAAGEAGHVLQLSAIYPEKWTWNGSELAVGAPESKFQGSWCSDGSPLLQIKFATKLKQFDNIRWLIVQKETSTTIFEPELRAKPVAGNISALGSNLGAAGHIATNPLVTITTEATGGQSQCDFSVNMGSNDDIPQLAIIDRSGKWSVWYITRDGHGRSRTIKPVLTKQGVFHFPLYAPPWNGAGFVDQTHRIVWTNRHNRVDEWERDSNLSEDFGLSSRALRSTYLTGADVPHYRCDGLLICNDMQLQVLNINGDKAPCWLDFSRRDGRDNLLHAHILPGSSSHVFVLTTEKLYLLDVSLVEGQEAKSPKILLSCRHFRNDHREALKMSVLKLRSSHDQASSLVQLYSTQSFRADLFWFTISQGTGAARFHHQVVQLPGLKSSDAGDSQGIESLMAVPLQLPTSNGKDSSDAGGGFSNDTHSYRVQVYQLLGLTTDLSLSSSIVAITQGVSRLVDIPVRAANSRWDEARRSKLLRKKYLREAEQAFVVPDETEAGRQLNVVRDLSLAENHEVAQLRFYLLKLVQEINRGLLGEAAGGSAEATLFDPFTAIRENLHSREQGDHVSLKPLSGFSKLWHPLELSGVEDSWSLNLRQLRQSQDVGLFDCGTYGSKVNVIDLFEKMSINWSARLPAESLRGSQWRYIELALERMAAEVYLSEKGVYMVPQSTSDLASKSMSREENRQDQDQNQSQDVWDEPISSQPRSRLALPTPSATPSSSRDTSEAVDGVNRDERDEESGQEDTAIARLRMYLPSIKFTPPPKDGPSRVISLWPEQRGVDPSDYTYRPSGKADAQTEAAKRRQEREAERQRRRAERKLQLGIKMEGAGESFSQPPLPTTMQSSPAPQGMGSRQAHSQGFWPGSSQVHSQGFGLEAGSQSRSQPQSLSQGFGLSQIMSQPLPGEFGGRPSRLKKKPKGKPRMQGFR